MNMKLKVFVNPKNDPTLKNQKKAPVQIKQTEK